MIDGIIFDMDGLMVDSETVSEEAFKQAIKEEGFTYSQDLQNNLIGRNDKDVIKIMTEFFKEEYMALKIQKRVIQLVDENFEKNGVPAKKGLYEIFEYLENRQIKIAVASSNFRHKIVDNLEKLNLFNRVDFISAGDEVRKSKPDPEIFLKACSGIGVKKNRALILEDSVFGVEGAYRAGINVIIVPDTLVHPQDSIDKAIAVCDDLIQVKEYIKQKSINS